MLLSTEESEVREMLEQALDKPSIREAQEAFGSAERMRLAGLRRGLYPRWFAAATALWAGVSATLIAVESPVWILLFVAGLIGYQLYRRKKGAWVQEVNSRRELLLVVALAILVCLIAAGGYVGRQHFDISWAPVISGATIALGLFLLMEITYRPVRTHLNSENSGE